MKAAVLGLVEGRRLRRMGIQETIWHEMFTRSAGTGLLQYSLILDSDRRLEPVQVRTALEALQRQFPLLRTRVECVDDANHLVTARCPDVPLAVLPPGGDWLAEHHRQLREQTIDTAAGPLWKATLLHSPTNFPAPAAPSHRAVVYLSICHTITDGSSNALLLGQLLENLDRVVRNCEPDDSEPAPVCPSMDDLMQAERVRLSPGLVHALLRAISPLLRRSKHPFLEAFVSPFDPALPPESYWNQMLPEALSPDESSRLRAQCRRHGVPMNAALSAAVSLAAARLLGGCSSAAAAQSALSLPTMWLVNARRYLPAARGLQLSAVSVAVFDVRVDAAPFWQLAARIHDQLNEQLQHKLPLVPWKLAIRFMTEKKIRAGLEKPIEDSPRSPFVYNINNLGSLDGLFPQTTAVRAVELHRTFRAHPGRDSSFGSHCFQTVASRLCYDLNFMHGRVREDDAKRFSQMVLKILREVAASAENG